MKRVTVRLDDRVHKALVSELKQWRKLRGPKYSLNDLCSEKLSQPVPATTWTTTGTFSGSNVNIIPPITLSIPIQAKDPKCQKKKMKP